MRETPRRTFGATKIDLSAVTFGTMRMTLDRADQAGWRALLNHLLDRGVDTFHTSPEYDSHELFLDCYAAVRRERKAEEHRHIVKIGVPHFEDDNIFDGRAFEALVDRERARLGTDRLDIVQWLVRSKPIEDPPRLAVLERYRDDIQNTVQRLRDRGAIGAVASFPYSLPFAKSVLELDVCAGLVTYLNFLELDYADQLDTLEQNGQGFVAIRPLAAARLAPRGFASRDDDAVAALCARSLFDASEVVTRSIQFTLLHPAVASTIVTVNSIGQADQVIEASDIGADATEFSRLLARLRD